MMLIQTLRSSSRVASASRQFLRQTRRSMPRAVTARYFQNTPRLYEKASLFADEGETEDSTPHPQFHLPQRLRHKILSVEDAVTLVRDKDTVVTTGFVCQGVAEAVLQALGKRYEETGHPNNLTLLFGGGPGDHGSRGLSHLAKVKDDGSPPMLHRTIGSHYGQVPGVAGLAVNETVEAWTLPMGSVSRMIRAQSTHSPGHITTVGIGTYVDPDLEGGAANEKAKNSPFGSHLISKIEIGGEINLMYRALPIDVAIIRGTTADLNGNITMEHESLLVDQRITATAAKSSGGIVIAQVKRMAATGSFSPREVQVPGALVDVIVVVDEKDHDTLHSMSFPQKANPAFTGELRTPADSIDKLPLDIRKVIARRSFFHLKPDKIVNLGIGLPEGVANVASEEGMLDYVTLTTEPGVFGGIPASGHSFGPAINPQALIEMNQMFDFYDGGGLDISFLGAAQISKNGDVNVSRMTKDRLTGPGGFIDISQSTKNICFLSSLTTKGLDLDIRDGELKIKQEGKVKKFVDKVFEITFSGDEAVRRGQNIHYITERAVFRRTAEHDVLELIEIAPGIDLQKDVLDQLDFEPAVSENLKTMDPRIFKEENMGVTSELFGSLADRCHYIEGDHVFYLNLFGVKLNTEEDIRWFFNSLRKVLEPHCKEKGPCNMAVINYNGFSVRSGLDNLYAEEAEKISKEYFPNVKRFSGNSFYHAKLSKTLKMDNWAADNVFDELDADEDGKITIEDLRTGMQEKFKMNLSSNQLKKFQRSANDPFVDRSSFSNAIEELLSGQL